MRWFLPLLAVLSLAFAPVPFPKPDRPDRQKIQRSWERIRYVHEGKLFREPPGIVVLIRGEQAIFGSGLAQTKWVLELRPESHPKAFTLKGVGSCAGTVLRGVYKLERDTLTFCFRADGKRQTDFDQSKPGVSLTVYKRVKR